MQYIGEKIEGKNYKERKTTYGLIGNGKEEIAVVYIEENNMYNLIGGKIEDGEKSIDALRRETKEEIGYTLKNIEYIENLGCYHYFDMLDKYELAIMDIYKANLDEKVCEPIEKDHQLVWTRPEDIADKMYFPYHRYIVKKYIKQI